MGAYPNHPARTAPMLSTRIRRTVTTATAIGALGLGGSAVAVAASTSTSKSGTSTTHTSQREALPADVAAKVKAAAIDKVPGATVLRTESGGPSNSAYHAHIKTANGTLQVVLVNSSFEATAVGADQGRGGKRHGGRGGHSAETALTGDTKDQVEAAVLGKYPGATIVRTETNTTPARRTSRTPRRATASTSRSL